MERKFLKDLGIESDSIDKILDQASADIGKHKTLADTAQANAQQLAQDIAKRDADIAALKSVDAADLQGKLDALQTQYDAALESRKQQDAQRVQADHRNAFFSDVAFASDYAKRGVMAEFDEKAFPYNEADNAFPGAKEWLAQLQASATSVRGARHASRRTAHPHQGSVCQNGLHCTRRPQSKRPRIVQNLKGVKHGH